MKCIAISVFCYLLTASTCSFAQQPGTLDGDFDANGSVITTITSGTDLANSVVVQPDGKIVVTGTSGSSVFSSDPSDYSTVRYLSDGSLDPSFGTNGMVTTSLGPNDNATSIVLQSDGKIIVGGSSNGITALQAFAIVRYNQDGSIDNSFSTVNGSGVFFGPLGDCKAIALQSDGKIVAAGTADNASDDFVVARYNTDGTIDNTFGTTGVVTTDFGGLEDFARSIAIQTDGKIIVAGSSNNGLDFDMAVVRYNLDGSLDNSFSINGMVTADFGNGDCGASKVLIQPNGKIVTTGSTLNDFQTISVNGLVRFNSDGTLDNSFGVSGKVVGNVEGGGRSSVLQPDGKILLVSSFISFTISRFNPDGTFDTDFGINGIVHEDIGIVDKSRCSSCALQPDGKIILVGSGQVVLGDDDFAVARFISGLNLGVLSFSSQDNGMLIYPNPLQERAVLEYTLAEDETISIDLFDMSGKLVQSLLASGKRSKGPHKETLVLDAMLSSGSYLLTLSNGTGTSSVRVSK